MTDGDSTTSSDFAPAELPPGYVLREYTIIEKIGAGGFAITYLAEDQLGRRVAIKECFPMGFAQRSLSHRVGPAGEQAEDVFEIARSQFLREGRTLASLDHPGVVRVITHFEENGTAFLVLDFVAGQTIDDLIREGGGQIGGAHLLDLTRALLETLDYIHGHDVLHRDIKPDNIIVTDTMRPVLIDFGAAKMETRHRSRAAGSFPVVADGYSPAEYYEKSDLQDPSSDLYSLAATLYCAITGAPPPSATTRALEIRAERPDPCRTLAGGDWKQAAELLALVDRGLAMAIADRTGTAQIWLSALAGVDYIEEEPEMSDTPTEPHFGRAGDPPPPPARGFGFGSALIGAAVTAAAAFGVWQAQPEWLMPEMSAMEAENTELALNLARAEGAQTAIEGRLDTLRSELRNAEGEVARLEREMGTMEGQAGDLDEARAARDDALAEIEGLQDRLREIDTLRADLEAAQTAQGNAEADVEALRAEIAQMQANPAANAALEEDLREAETALEAANAEIARLSGPVGEAEELRNLLEETEIERDELATTLAEMQAELPAWLLDIADVRDAAAQELSETQAMLEQEQTAFNAGSLRSTEAALAANRLRLQLDQLEINLLRLEDAAGDISDEVSDLGFDAGSTSRAGADLIERMVDSANCPNTLLSSRSADTYFLSPTQGSPTEVYATLGYDVAVNLSNCPFIGGAGEATQAPQLSVFVPAEAQVQSFRVRGPNRTEPSHCSSGAAIGLPDGTFFRGERENENSGYFTFPPERLPGNEIDIWLIAEFDSGNRCETNMTLEVTFQ